MTAASIRRIAMQVIADQQALISVDADRNDLIHLLGWNNGVLALAEELIDSLVESQTMVESEDE